jgi:hypothetical protein
VKDLSKGGRRGYKSKSYMEETAERVEESKQMDSRVGIARWFDTSTPTDIIVTAAANTTTTPNTTASLPLHPPTTTCHRHTSKSTSTTNNAKAPSTNNNK